MRRELTAAASRVKLDDRKAVKAAAARQDWQEDAWSYFDLIPEVKFAVLYVAAQLSKLRLYVAAYPQGAPPGAKPVPIDDPSSGVPLVVAAQAKAELARLQSTTGGHAELLARLAINLDVAGECHLCGFGATDSTPEEWLIASTSELGEKGGNLTLKGAPDDRNPRVLDRTRDTAIRVWLKHGRWMQRADSHVHGILGVCKTLNLLARQVDAEALSRLAAGILAVPSEIEGKPTAAAVEDQAADGEDAPEDPFLEELEEALVTPIEEPGSATAVVPFVVRAPAEALKELRHILLGRTSDATLDKRLDAAINRVARGLNVPVEVVMGHMATTFANAEQIDRDTWEDYLEGRSLNIVEAITYGFLRPNLLTLNPALVEPIGRVVVWFDESALIAQPQPAESANDAIDRGLITPAAWRAAKGWSEDDAPPELPAAPDAGSGDFAAIAEAVQKVYLGVGVVLSVEEARDIINKAGANLGPVPPELASSSSPAPAATPSAATPGAPPPAPDAALAGSGRRDHGARLAAIDRELRSRLLTAANDAMTRALERAGNKLRSRANGQRDTLRRVPALEVAATLGPTLVAAAGGTDDLFLDAWDDLERQYREWGAIAQRDALEVAGEVAGRWNIAQRAELQLRQARNLDEGWSWLKEGLTSLAGDRLFDPHPSAPTLGEHDPLLRVPPGAIRNAVAIAGGAPLATTDGRAAFVTIGVAGENVGGIGTGKLLTDAMRDAGAKVEGYRWVYGPALRQRPFKPHLALDGKVFRYFDDAVLANHHGFPSVSHFIPGDHPGCICDVEPILLTAEEAAAAGFQLDTPTPTERLAAEAVTPPKVVDPPTPRPDPTTLREQAAAKYGVTVAELEQARKRLPEFRAWARAEAKRVQGEAFATLDRADVLHMDRPVPKNAAGLVQRSKGIKGARLGGEWDWLEGLDEGERSRLRRAFRAGDNGGSPDNIADRLRQAGLVTEDLSDDEVIAQVWLPLNRQVEAAGALARGKLPSPRAYSGAIDPDTLLPALEEEGFKASAIFDPDDLEGAGHIASVWREQAYTEARRALSSQLYPVHGPAPWRMTFDSFAEEVADLEYAVENGLDDADFARARLRELIPFDLDEPGLSLAELYDNIIATARLADEDVAEWIEVY